MTPDDFPAYPRAGTAREWALHNWVRTPGDSWVISTATKVETKAIIHNEDCGYLKSQPAVAALTDSEVADLFETEQRLRKIGFIRLAWCERCSASRRM